MRSTTLGLIAALALWFAAPASAQPPLTLSGTVQGGANPLQGAVVRALQDNSTTIVAAATTNALGEYSISLEPGTYDISVVPAFGSGFLAEIIQDQVMGGDETLNVTLSSSSESVLSGTLRGRNGQPVPDVFIQSQTALFLPLFTFTDAAGRYSLHIGDATTFLFGTGAGQPGVAPPSFSFQHFGITVAGATTHDVNLPVVQISGRVLDPSANTVSDATVQIGTSFFDDVSGYSSFAFLTTNNQGEYSTLVISGTVDTLGAGSATATAPSGSPFLPVTVALTLSTTDLVQDLTLNTPVTLSGTLRGRNAAPIPAADVSVFVGSFFASTTTNANGQYSLQVPTGNAFLQGSGSGPSGVAPGSFAFQRFDIAISGPTVVDITLPVVALTGHVFDPDSVAVASATVEASTSGFDGSSGYFASAFATTDANGAYSALLVAGDGAVTARPPSGTALLPVSAALELTGDTELNLSLGTAQILSGTLRGRNNTPIENATVRAFVNFGTFETTTDNNGNYSLPIETGTVTLQISGNGPDGVAPPFFQVQRSDLVVSGPTTADFTLSTAQVSIVVTDSNGVLIPNVFIEGGASSSDATTSFVATASGTTDDQGAVQFLLVTGDGGFTFFPPASLLAGSINAAIPGDMTLRIVVQRSDTVAPVITAGPVIVHLSDNSATVAWTTNEAASSTVDYGLAGGGLTSSAGDGNFTTNHVVTLLGLDPSTAYDFQVGSFDTSSNGPTTSGVGTFTTLASPGDVTAPVFTAGPTIVSISNTFALVQWKTDEPAIGFAEFGETLPGTFTGSLAFTQIHSLPIFGLLPSTTYFVRVTTIDPDGNSSTSSVISFVTANAPDTTPPVITDGPTVEDVTDTTITIRWTTNEPATSSVSFNDGAVFDLVDDAALVTEHVVTLTGLNPGSSYFLTVSSTDAYGNGPTLSAQGVADTDGSPDTTDPTITGATAVDISQTGAAIVWTTDEPATSEVAFGTVQGSPDDIRASLTRSTSHRIELNGLQPGTDYFTIIRSTDVSGNSATAEVNFRTRSVCGAQAPAPAGPLTGPSSPTNLDPYTIGWAPSPDAACLSTYEVLRNGVVIATVAPTVNSIEDGGLADGAYDYVVRSNDTSGPVALSSLSPTLHIVIDHVPPVLTLPGPITVNSAGVGGEIVDFVATAVDAVDGPVPVTCAPPSGSLFPFTTTTVTCNAQDAAGNVSTGDFTVTVVDIGPPVITDVTPSLTVLWPPNHQMVPITITVTATDNSGVAPTCSVTSVSSNEPQNGLGDGDTPIDWLIAAANTVVLRAERSGKGNTAGRVYTINVTCSDQAGNTATGMTTVSVPKNKKP